MSYHAPNTDKNKIKIISKIIAIKMVGISHTIMNGVVEVLFLG